jgi:hypothetical protein
MISTIVYMMVPHSKWAFYEKRAFRSKAPHGVDVEYRGTGNAKENKIP